MEALDSNMLDLEHVVGGGPPASLALAAWGPGTLYIEVVLKGENKLEAQIKYFQC